MLGASAAQCGARAGQARAAALVGMLAGMEAALARGHRPLALEAKPSFANLPVWKIVYRTEDRFHVDSVRAGR